MLGKRLTYWRRELKKVSDFRTLPIDAIDRAQTIEGLHHIARSSQVYGFNGQILRLKYVSWLYKELHCNQFIETGTRWGYTAITARKILPGEIFSVELIRRNYYHALLLAGLTFGSLRGLHLKRGDSRKVLTEWFERMPRHVRPMLYLDAHFFEDHPLVNEIQQAVKRGNCVVVIDDFKVPHENGFGWDSKKGFDVKIESILSALPGDRVKVLFPAHKSQQETSSIVGQPRGTCILLIDLDVPSSHNFPADLFTEFTQAQAMA